MFVALAFIAAACGPPGSDTTRPTPSGDPAPTSTAPSNGVASATIDEIVSEFVDSGPGGADVLIRRGGATTRAVAGIASSNEDAITSGRPFLVGSLPKPFIATMVLQLVDEGSVDLDQTLGTYLPTATIGEAVTIR